jgi:ribonuclease P/MRP protein subunit POP7
VQAFFGDLETHGKYSTKRRKLGSGNGSGEGGCDVVSLRATGKAIDRCLQLGAFFMERGHGVKVKTGTVGVVDDVVDVPEGWKGKVKMGKMKTKARNVPTGDESKEDEMVVNEGLKAEYDDDEDDGPDMVARYVSTVEVLISKKGND